MWFFTPKRFLISVVVLMIASTGAALSLVIRPTQPTIATSEVAIAPSPSPLPQTPENWAIYANSLDGYAFYYPSHWQIVERTEKAKASAFIAEDNGGARLRVWTGAFPVSFAVAGDLVEDREVWIDGERARQRLYRDGVKRTGMLTDFVYNGLAVTVEFTVAHEEHDEWVSWNTFRDRFHFLR